MKKGDITTIEKAFDEANEKQIYIQYVWKLRCSQCSNIFWEEDNEYSFEGTKWEFMTRYGMNMEYGEIMELDDEVTCIFPEQNIYRFENIGNDKCMCSLCQDCEGIL